MYKAKWLFELSWELENLSDNFSSSLLIFSFIFALLHFKIGWFILKHLTFFFLFNLHLISYTAAKLRSQKLKIIIEEIWLQINSAVNLSAKSLNNVRNIRHRAENHLTSHIIKSFHQCCHWKRAKLLNKVISCNVQNNSEKNRC